MQQYLSAMTERGGNTIHLVRLARWGLYSRAGMWNGHAFERWQKRALQLDSTITLVVGNETKRPMHEPAVRQGIQTISIRYTTTPARSMHWMFWSGQVLTLDLQ